MEEKGKVENKEEKAEETLVVECWSGFSNAYDPAPAGPQPPGIGCLCKGHGSRGLQLSVLYVGDESHVYYILESQILFWPRVWMGLEFIKSCWVSKCQFNWCSLC